MTKNRTGYPVIDEILESVAPPEQRAADYCSECLGTSHTPWCSEYEEPEVWISHFDSRHRKGEPCNQCASHEQPAEDYDLQGMLDQIAAAYRDQHAQLTSLREQNERLREASESVVSRLRKATQWKTDCGQPVPLPTLVEIRHAEKELCAALNHAEQGEGS